MRGIKTQQEVLKIKKACQLGDKVYFQILKNLKTGVSERGLRLEIERLVRKNGASLSFRPIVAFGKNTSEPHHVATHIKLRKNHGFVLLDLGAKVNGYCSDMSRTVFFGKANTKQKRIYKTVLEAQKKAVQQLNNLAMKQLVIKASEIDKVSRDYIIKKRFPSIPHTLGHGIGKKVHEAFRLGPKSKTILKNGMVFTIEPGIYIKGYGGVRIEDVFYLNKGKLTQLTKSPKNLIEL